jgi:phosphoglycerol transferase MdoB-like AlkP superfamily enzyme
METETSNIQRLITKLKAATVSFTVLSLVWLILLFIVSVFEITYNGIVHEFPDLTVRVMLWSVLDDIAFLFTYLFVIYIVYLLIYLLSAPFAKLFYKVFIAVSLVIDLGLIMYFSTTLLPLGADIYGYSWADIKQTIGASGGLNLLTVIVFLIFIAGIVAALYYLPRKPKFKFKAAIILPALAFVLLFVNLSFLKNPGNLGSDFDNNLAVNKSDFFYSSSLNHFYPGEDEVDIYADSYIGDYEGQKSTITDFNYVDAGNYPFLHTDSTKDVLSPFLKPAATIPNIVIIMVEGLGRAFTNEGAYLGNFTPFIDSLSNKSLYWRNFLSSGGRTFAVLPSLLGSLPFAKNGFLELSNKMPPHVSLLSLLKYNGYHTSFYYGGDALFDNMKMFLQKNNTDEINDEKSVPQGYVKLPATNGFTWGYNDKELFRHYFATRPVTPQPQLSVILTVATHDPFVLNEQEAYLKRFEQRMTQLGFNETQKNRYRNYKLQYASILYADDAVKGFFAEYSKRSDYANTIFLITGDHRMPEIPMRDKIDRYHVPLIIYSPMLKRTSQMASISTHFDISPSLVAYLKHNYKLKGPSLVSWMGQGLDTTVSFQNVHQYPLMQTKTDMVDFISGEHHINGNQLFKLSPEMDEDPVQDDNKFNQLKNGFDQFKKRNTQVTNGAKIIPDTIAHHYMPIK